MKVATVPAALIVMLALLALPLAAQANKTLFIATDDGDIEVPLESWLNILSDGNIEATAVEGFSCAEDTGDCPECPSCDEVDVSLSGNDGGVLKVTPGTVSLGNSVTVEWYGRGAWQCDGSGLPGTTWNTNNPKQARGTATISTDGLTVDTTYNVALDCYNGPNNATRSVPLLVESSDDDDDDGGDIEVPSSCGERTLLSDVTGWSLADDVVIGRDSDPSRYLGVFQGGESGEFPGTRNSFDFYLRKQRYAAMQFTVPENIGTADGTWGFEMSHYAPGGLMLIAISDCPADFKYENFADKSCISVYEHVVGKHTTRWTTDPNETDSRYCLVEPGQSYYMNVIYVNDLDIEQWPPQQSECNGSSRCALVAQPQS